MYPICLPNFYMLSVKGIMNFGDRDPLNAPLIKMEQGRSKLVSVYYNGG
jgi:hypothetical protein